MQVAKRELAIECDYENELQCQQRFARIINDDPELSPHFHVPAPIPELSSSRVLASEWVPGVHIDRVRLQIRVSLCSPAMLHANQVAMLGHFKLGHGGNLLRDWPPRDNHVGSWTFSDRRCCNETAL